jgi:hypothetical protein
MLFWIDLKYTGLRIYLALQALLMKQGCPWMYRHSLSIHYLLRLPAQW